MELIKVVTKAFNLVDDLQVTTRNTIFGMDGLPKVAVLKDMLSKMRSLESISKKHNIDISELARAHSPLGYLLQTGQIDDLEKGEADE